MAVAPFTYDPTTPRGQVRLLAVDSEAAYADFADPEIDAFLSLSGGVVLLGAASVLDTKAARAAIVQGVTKFAGVALNGQFVAMALHEQAMALRERCYMGDDGSGISPITWAEMVVDPFTYRDRLVNEMLRNST
jgi:hypothetical protein